MTLKGNNFYYLKNFYFFFLFFSLEKKKKLDKVLIIKAGRDEIFGRTIIEILI